MLFDRDVTLVTVDVYLNRHNCGSLGGKLCKVVDAIWLNACNQLCDKVGRVRCSFFCYILSL